MNAKNNSGQTPLLRVILQAVSNSQLKAMPNAQTETAKILDTVKVLLDSKADVNVRDNFGVTALLLAAQRGRADLVEVLLDKDADVNAKTKEGVTALMAAAEYGHTEIVKSLLDKGADVNITRNNGNNTALSYASQNRRTDIIQLLIKAGAK